MDPPPYNFANPDTRVRELQDKFPDAPENFCRYVVEDEAPKVGLKVFILDNSGSTAKFDGRIWNESRRKYTDATRWEEIKAMAIENLKFCHSAGILCEFHLLNEAVKGRPREGSDWVRVQPTSSYASAFASLQSMLASTAPRGATPLAERLAVVRERLGAACQHDQGFANRRSFIVLVTDGIPTPAFWSSTQSQEQQMNDASKRMVDEMRMVSSSFNVSIIVRLCTDDEKDIAFWNELDNEEEFSLDVLDDLESEAKEISALDNDVCVYGRVLHTFREGGTCERIFDLIDETPFKAAQAGKIIELLILGSAPQNPDFTDIERYVKAAVDHPSARRQVFDPHTGKMVRNWVNSSKLRRRLGGGGNDFLSIAIIVGILAVVLVFILQNMGPQSTMPSLASSRPR